MVTLILILAVVAILALFGTLADDFGVDSRDFAAQAREYATRGD